MSFFKSLLRNAGRTLGAVAIGAVTGGMSAAIGGALFKQTNKLTSAFGGVIKGLFGKLTAAFRNTKNANAQPTAAIRPFSPDGL